MFLTTYSFNKWKLVAQLYQTLCNPVAYSPSGSSAHGILQARILEWVAISFSGGSAWPRDWTQVSCTAGRLYSLSHQGNPECAAYRCTVPTNWKQALWRQWSMFILAHLKQLEMFTEVLGLSRNQIRFPWEPPKAVVALQTHRKCSMHTC